MIKSKLNNKISKSNTTQQYCNKNSTILFSFDLLTSNEDYGFNHKSANVKSYKALRNILNSISKKTWEEFQNEDHKKAGFETISSSDFKESFINSFPKDTFTSDVKLYVTRFDGIKRRMIFIRGTDCKYLMHILGFDWDLSLYKH